MASPLEDVSLSGILRYGRDRLGRIAGEVPNEIAAGYRDLADLGGKVVSGITRRDNPYDENLKRQMQAKQLRGGDDYASMTETPFGTHTSGDPAVKAAGIAGDPLNWIGAGAGGAAVKKGGKLLDEQLLGRFKTTTPGRIVNETTKGGGYSVNLPSGERPTEGLMMGKYRNDDPRNLVTDALTRNQLAEMVTKNKEALGREDAYLGTWRDPEGGKTYVDVSKRFPSDEVRQATKYGERSGQLAGWNVSEKQQFPVKSWEQFIAEPEFNRRMHELNREGGEYLGASGKTPEWWGGSTFERVYGPENRPQVAGFIASTAPNNLLRNNVQQTTEYLRRHIKGEPIVQPDWRAGDDLMTWKPGSMIGMEEGRANNLQKSARGDLDQLQADKVREEAAAMMGDPNAAPLDRYWARVAEDPASGVFTAAKEGVVEPGKQYAALKKQVWTAAEEAGVPLRTFSANVWTAIRERIRTHGELYGQKFRKGAAGESKSYDDHFKDLIAEKAKHLGITVPEMEKRLSSGDGNLLAWLAATPLLAPVIGDVLGGDREAMQ